MEYFSDYKKKAPAIARVKMTDAYCETRGFDQGLTGIWRRNDESQKDVAVVEISEKPFEIRVHKADLEIF